jgi:16S rRNA (adenine1518-N6/adenine1519-N6)-dimethyltransferase
MNNNIPFDIDFSFKSPQRILRKAKTYAKKSLGQHFLNQPNIARSIIEKSCISNVDTIIEIGPGLGALTFPLAKHSKHVYGVDLDQKLLNLLSEELKTKHIQNVSLIHGDILYLPFDSILSQHEKKYKVMGNLPYHISSQILVKLVKERKNIDKAVVMLQKEMAERIQSPPGSKAYGRLSVMVQYCASVKPLITIKGSDFFPRVNVDSQVIQLCFHQKIENQACDENFLFQTIKAAFGKRRKTLKNALSRSDFHFNADTIIEALNKIDIDPQRRAETLSVKDFVCLSNILKRAHSQKVGNLFS